ncbi:MAG: LysR family transcriptional regulator [Desulfovibrionaceae bacterium]|jgi:DNA-binding transcriptional LysR family regulator|nr:LysR family transcriptional regulator [Desulfovibrionaceae bacterium]
MDFRRLEAFCKVYELKSFSKAGNELFLSQPTISAHVSALEKHLGVQLFDRLGRTILPTTAGDTLYRHARKAFTILETARAEIELLQDRVSGEVLLGGSTIPAHHLLPPIIARYMRQYPAVTVRLRVGDTAEIVDLVARGELTLGVVGARLDRQDLEYKPLYKDLLVVVCAPDAVPLGPDPERPAAFSAELEKAALESRWILRESGSGTRRAFESALADLGRDVADLQVVMEAESTPSAVQCARAGMGLTVTSRLAVREFLADGSLVALPLPGLSVRRTIYSVCNERRHVFPAVRYLMECIATETAALEDA